ncbi:MAG: HAMP domain-containing sensor histidine kinase [Longimicrobiales bacterium]
MNASPVAELPAALTGALDALIEEGGPDLAEGATLEAVVRAARHAAEVARYRPRADDEGPRPGDPADRLAAALVRWGDRRVDLRIGPWEADDGPPADDDPETLLRDVVAVKRSVRLAVFSVDAHVRDVHRRRATERGRVLGAFGRTLAHEIKNRLGAAETALLMLDQMGETSEATRARIYGMVEKALDGALRSVDDVRGLTLYRDPTRFPATRPERLGEVARRAAESVRGDAEAAGVEIGIEDLPDVWVDGGPARLVLTNLIENGVKYADPDRPDRWVRVGADEDGDTVRIVVEDNGVGIPDEFHESVFLRSVRVSNDGRGSGLGLAIVRDALRELGGDITLESEPGRGTRIAVTLPVRTRRA